MNKPEDWMYSNYREWVGLRNNGLVDRDFVISQFSSTAEYARFVNNVEEEKQGEERISKYLFD